MHEITSMTELPSIPVMFVRLRGLAILDAVMTPNWESRYFSFNSKWDGTGAEQMASMRNGSGSEYFILFDSTGVVGKVYSPSSAGIARNIDAVPNEFAAFKAEPAFKLEDATYFFWRLNSESKWTSEPELEQYDLLRFVVDGAEYYKNWAEWYYERPVDVEVARQVLENGNIKESQALTLNSDVDWDSLREDLAEVGV